MTTGSFATLLIIGIMLYAFGKGGWIALVLIAIGGIGIVVSAFGGKK